MCCANCFEALTLSLSLLFETVKLLFGGGTSNDGALFACQLGVVGCLWAGVYELGRRDVGVALRSRAEDDARDKVWAEFQVRCESTPPHSA